MPRFWTVFNTITGAGTYPGGGEFTVYWTIATWMSGCRCGPSASPSTNVIKEPMPVAKRTAMAEPVPHEKVLRCRRTAIASLASDGCAGVGGTAAGGGGRETRPISATWLLIRWTGWLLPPRLIVRMRLRRFSVPASRMMELVPIALLPLSVCHDIWDFWVTGLDCHRFRGNGQPRAAATRCAVMVAAPVRRRGRRRRHTRLVHPAPGRVRSRECDSVGPRPNSALPLRLRLPWSDPPPVCGTRLLWRERHRR